MIRAINNSILCLNPFFTDIEVKFSYFVIKGCILNVQFCFYGELCLVCNYAN